MKAPAPPATTAAPLLLAVAGMDERPRHLLDMVLQRHRPDSVRLVPVDEAVALVVDLDGVGAAERLRHARLAGGRPLLLLSVTAPDAATLADDLFVAKPIATPMLLAALDELACRCRAPAMLPVPAVPAQPAPVPAPPVLTVVPPPEPVIAAAPPSVTVSLSAPPVAEERLPAAPEPAAQPTAADIASPGSYDPARYLQGVVLMAIREASERGQTALVRGPWPSLTLLPAQGLAVIADSEDALQRFAAQADMASRAKVSYLPAPDTSLPPAGAVALDNLVWKLSLWASRGRLPAGTDPDRPVRLHQQPDLSRLEATPGGPQLALLWSRQAVSLRDTPAQARLPAEQVFSFYSAIHALGMVDDSPVKATVAVPPRLEDQHHPDDPRYVTGSFARRFLARLRGTN